MQMDINCDLGEGMGDDAAILPFINSANIACGYHAGSEFLIRKTIMACKENNVKVGAHPSFNDRENFGRKEWQLSTTELYELLMQQLTLFKKIADECDMVMHHVKPHGALYNLSAKDTVTAQVLATCIKDFDNKLIVYGLSGSHSISEAEAIGLTTANEVFADRTYQDDGSLTPRSSPGALIANADEAIKQVLQMVKTNSVTTVSGKNIPLRAETICIHGDGPHALEFAKAISAALLTKNNL